MADMPPLPQNEEDFRLPALDLPLNIEPDLDLILQQVDLGELDAADLWELEADDPDLLTMDDLADIFDDAPSPEPVVQQDFNAALEELGLAVPGHFELGNHDDPFLHPDSPAAFWFGTLQPDPEHNPAHHVAGILALNPTDEGLAVDFAAYANGSREECHTMTDTLIQTATDNGLEQAFDKASELSIQHQSQPFAPTSPDIDL